MIDEELLTKLVYEIAQKFEAVNTHYIDMMGKHVKDIGDLTASDIHRAEQMVKMGHNVDELKKELALASGATSKEIDDLFNIIVKGQYKDSEALYNLAKGKQIPYEENKTLLNYVASVAKATSNSMLNISNTTAVEKQYRDIVDKAISLVSSGVESYTSQMRRYIRQTTPGMKIQYKSGYTRRLDSAVRMNILDGVRAVNQGTREIMGKQFGADGVEISAHALCAEDHLDIQGQQLTLQEFKALQNTLVRPIGELNCTHTISYIVLGVSEPAYSQEELNELKDLSNEKIQIGETEKTRYEWTQECRRLETQMRYTKEDFILGHAMGDDKLMEQSKERINTLQGAYRVVCEQANLEKHYERAYVPGYRKN